MKTADYDRSTDLNGNSPYNLNRKRNNSANYMAQPNHMINAPPSRFNKFNHQNLLQAPVEFGGGVPYDQSGYANNYYQGDNRFTGFSGNSNSFHLLIFIYAEKYM